jgi:hypothetical protein
MPSTENTAAPHATLPSQAGIVVVRLNGGLGNQLFQYAAARRLALVSGLRLKLDLGALGRRLHLHTNRSYRLGHLQIVEDFASPADVSRLKRSSVASLFEELTRRRHRRHVRERHFHFDPDILEIRSEVYLAGYWQSEKYFADIAPTIRAEVSVREAPTGENLRLLELIEGGDSVGIHVRRGDYVTNLKSRRLHGNCCPPDYYRAGMEEIGRRARDPRFFVFSDDIPWARENLRIDGPTWFVDHNGPDEDYQDLRLLSRCRHHIIANSSFSWWGAWLGAHDDQIVVAPRRWFASGKRRTHDLCPARWLKM